MTNLRCTEPLVLLLEVLHGAIPVVEILVLEHIIVNEVPLTACVVVAAVVSVSGEVQPLGVTEFVAWLEKKTNKSLI